MGALRNLMPIAAASFALVACGGGGASTKVGDIAANEPSLGKADAPVTMIEYASTSCSHCARFNNDVMPEFKAKYIDTGQVHYALREIVTAPESLATAAFLMAKCAGNDRYYAIIDAVYRSQAAMFQTGDFAGGLKPIALSAGMTEDQFNKCVTDDKEILALDARVKANSKAGEIKATPTFFFNGKKAEGEMTMAQLDKLVADAKAAKK